MIMMYRPTTRLDKISYEAGNQSDRQGGESRTQELTCFRLRPHVAQEKPGPPQKPPRRGPAWPKHAPRTARRQLRGQSCSLSTSERSRRGLPALLSILPVSPATDATPQCRNYNCTWYSPVPAFRRTAHPKGPRLQLEAQEFGATAKGPRRFSARGKRGIKKGDLCPRLRALAAKTATASPAAVVAWPASLRAPAATAAFIVEAFVN